MKQPKIIITFVEIICCLLIATHLHADSEYSQGGNAGGVAGSSILSEIGSGDQINQRMAVPMTSSGTEMKTFGPEDEKETFGVQLSAPSSEAFLVLFVQPSATGDLSTVEARQDLNYDGEPDYVYALPFPVSGVCANGVIGCTPGTWNDCRYFSWATDNDGKVALNEEAGIGKLAGCYCINSSCGSDLVWNNLVVILKDMGGAVAGSIQNNDPHLTITSVNTSENAVYYYGQKTSELAIASQGDQVYLSGSTTPENYYGGNIPTDDEVFKQSPDPDSYYSQLLNSSAAQDSDISMYSCTTTHNISVNHSTQEVGNNGHQTVCLDHYLYIRIHESEGTIHFQWEGTSPGGSPGWNCGGAGWQDVASVNTSATFSPGSEITIITFNAGIYAGGGCPAGSITLVNGGTSGIVATCGAGGAQAPTLYWSYSIEAILDIPELTVQNNCNPAPGCRLKEETVCDESGENCVQTRMNFSPTGLAPMPYCKTIDAIGHTYTACMDGGSATIFKDADIGQVLGSGENIWWNIERTYQCETDNEYDFENLKQRTQHISDTIEDNTTSMYYEDYNPDTGTVEGHTVELQSLDNFDTCEKGCKVRRIVQDTQATTSGTTADYRNSVSSYEDVYRACVNGSCPVSSGETILTDCTCISEFSKAISLMQVMDNASHDIICSGD